jgi:hypothetical protein
MVVDLVGASRPVCAFCDACSWLPYATPVLASGVT